MPPLRGSNRRRSPRSFPSSSPIERVPDAGAELAAIRERLVALAREAETIERAPVPLAEALHRLEALAHDVAARRASRRADQARTFFAPAGVRSVGALVGLTQGFAESPRELADTILEQAEADFLAEQKQWREAIRAHTPPGEPISSADRPKRLAEIERQRRELEVREEQIILSAERDGLDLDRAGERADVPDIVACVVLADAAA